MSIINDLTTYYNDYNIDLFNKIISESTDFFISINFEDKEYPDGFNAYINQIPGKLRLLYESRNKMILDEKAKMLKKLDSINEDNLDIQRIRESVKSISEEFSIVDLKILILR